MTEKESSDDTDSNLVTQRHNLKLNRIPNKDLCFKQLEIIKYIETRFKSD